MAPDTLIVMTQSLSHDRDLLPFWTGLGGAALGIIGTVIATVGAYFVAKRQIGVQQEIAQTQFQLQRDIADRELKATLIASNRIRWVEQVREEIAAIMHLAEGVPYIKSVADNHRIVEG